MTAITTTDLRAALSPTARTPIFGDVVRSEWTKLRTVRSTYRTLVASVVATVGIGALVCAIYASQYPTMSASDRAGFDPTSFSLSGVFLAQLAIGVLGVLIITGEYGTGSIRSTFAAVPQRRTVLAAKATVFSAVALVVGVVSCFVAFFIGQAILSTQGISASITDPNVLQAIVGSGVYLAVLGLLALGVGTLIRHTAGAIAALFGVILVLPGLIQLLPSSISNAVAKYMPAGAGQAISHTVHTASTARGGSSLSPLVGLFVFCLYAAAALGFAAVVISRRDA